MQTTTSTCHRSHICGALGIIDLGDSYAARLSAVWVLAPLPLSAPCITRCKC